MTRISSFAWIRYCPFLRGTEVGIWDHGPHMMARTTFARIRSKPINHQDVTCSAAMIPNAYLYARV